MTNKLDDLKLQYEKLGEEIKKLGKVSTVRLALVKVPSEFDVHVAPNYMTWQEAMDYAEIADMRLPTKLELQVIAGSGCTFGLGYVWSASTLSDYPSNAWVVNLTTEGNHIHDKSYDRPFICVAK